MYKFTFYMVTIKIKLISLILLQSKLISLKIMSIIEVKIELESYKSFCIFNSNNYFRLYIYLRSTHYIDNI